MKLTIGFYIDSVKFTREVVTGVASLGGSESACVGLARALKARGHDVFIFTTHLSEDAPAIDHAGVHWVDANEIDGITRVVDWDVFVALRMPHCFMLPIRAKYRVLWNQDMMTGEQAKQVTMALAWAYDAVVYVSEYHRKQWEGCIPELKPIGYVTKNGFDPQYVPTDVTKNPNQIIHISRPERGLAPLLQMWPELKKRYPDAVLKICRYQSMYDGEGSAVKAQCEAFDKLTAQLNESVGGIEWLGSLGKPELYKAIAESAVMWYPGVADFAETSCIAAIESQACGTPFVGSYKGALPETIPSGFLFKGDASTDASYQEASIGCVIELLQQCKRDARGYREWQDWGRAHVFPAYTYDAIAAEWEGWLLGEFGKRLKTQAPQILNRLLHEDDHVAALRMAIEMGDRQAVVDDCRMVIDGKEHTATDYAANAMNPFEEMQCNGRIQPVAERLKDCTRILDLACGNGSMALSLLQANPTCTVVGIDYAQGNIDVATEAAKVLGLQDRATFLCAPVYDFEKHELHNDLLMYLIQEGTPKFDGVFIGEFLEHIANVTGFLNGLASLVGPGVQVVATMPSGPYGELNAREVPYKRGHVHHFRPDDLVALFGKQPEARTDYIEAGLSHRFSILGSWLISYKTSATPIGERDLGKRILTTRPMLRLSVGIIAGDTTDIRRCLQSVWSIADEIVIGDTGCKPGELDVIVREYPKTRVVPVGRVHDLPGGFSEARNVVLKACTGEWFLWIDTDEVLVGAESLHRYLEGGIFNGYALKQNHLMLDQPKSFDTPVRVFRRQPAIQFYGCIHEQPQMNDCNGDILPTLQLQSVGHTGGIEIAHVLGYLTEEIRQKKALERNLPLLIRDQKEFPDRRLGKLLWVREFTNMASKSMEATSGTLNSRAREYFQSAIAMFEKHFLDPKDKLHDLGRPFYEAALKHVAGAMEVEFAFGARQGGMGKAHPRGERVWVRNKEHLESILKARVEEWTKPMQPEVIDVEPIEQVEGAPV